jgi:hypothetical protein
MGIIRMGKSMGYRSMGYRSMGYRSMGYKSMGIRVWEYKYGNISMG